MSFQKNKPNGYMEALDRWTEDNVIAPLVKACSGQFDFDAETEEAVELATEQVKRAIRDKTLDSYHNGQKAGPRKPSK